MRMVSLVCHLLFIMFMSYRMLYVVMSHPKWMECVKVRYAPPMIINVMNPCKLYESLSLITVNCAGDRKSTQ